MMSLSALGLIALAGCHNDMWRQPKLQPLAESDFFVDKQASRPLVAHTVARNPYGKDKIDEVRTDNPIYTGFENRDGKAVLVTAIPEKVILTFGKDGDSREDHLKAMLHRGQERFNIFCSPCHGRLGDGNGMIAQRGFNLRRKPASYHTDKLRKIPDGHIFDVITNGFGVMFSYASRVEPEDRWAIISYIRALQLSQNATVADVPSEKVPDLDKPAEAPREKTGGQGATE